jgi:5-methylcytosine-specific restriction endonuclease McrA
MNSTQIILLDHNFTFLNLISIKKAIKLMVKSKVEVVKSTNKELRCGMLLPKVIRLLKAINVSMKKFIPFSKQNIFIRDEFECSYCGKELNVRTATVDHIVPQAKGGKNSYTNCTTSCKPCNQWKSDKHLHETSMQLIRKPYHPNFLDFLYLKAKSMGVDLKEIWA